VDALRELQDVESADMNTIRLPMRQKSDELVKALRRIDALVAANKAANGRERFWRAVAMTAVNADPSATVERFRAGMAALLEGLQVHNAHLAPQLAPDAAAYVLTNVHGPYIALYLVDDPALAQRLTELAPADQLVELGRVSIAIEAALRPPGEQPRNVADIFGLAARAAP
jgi:hypothetical protein